MSDNYYFIKEGVTLLVLKKKKQTNKQKQNKTKRNKRKDALGNYRVTCRLQSRMTRPPISLLLISTPVPCIVNKYMFVSGPETRT